MTASKNHSFPNGTIEDFLGLGSAANRLLATAAKGGVLRLVNVDGMLKLASVSSVVAMVFYAASTFFGA